MEARDAATVMLVRDTVDDGMQVFMLRRNLNSDFVGGAYVFPGGAVDEADRHEELAPICRGVSDDAASNKLGIASGGLAFWVAAVRECFEEAGVLLATPRGSDTFLSFTDNDTAARYDDYRARVDTGELRLVELAEREGLQLACDRIHYFSHWITPEGQPRRYDTRFFVAVAPPEQVPLHDDRETIANLWVNPTEALARHRAGELEMIFPTIKNLEAISRFDTAEALVGHAASIDEVPTVQPRAVFEGGGMRILLPGDEGYDRP